MRKKLILKVRHPFKHYTTWWDPIQLDIYNTFVFDDEGASSDLGLASGVTVVAMTGAEVLSGVTTFSPMAALILCICFSTILSGLVSISSLM